MWTTVRTSVLGTYHEVKEPPIHTSRMNARNAVLAVVTGFAGFMLATVAVTALLEPRIEFSVLVGLPAGVLVGLVLTWYVYTRLTRAQTGASGSRPANALVAGAVAFILVMAVAITVGVGATGSLLAAVVLAIAAGVVMYVRGPRTL